MYNVSNILARKNSVWLTLATSVFVADTLKNYDEVLVTITPSNSVVVSQHSLRLFTGAYHSAVNQTIVDFLLGYSYTLPVALSPIKTLNHRKSVLYSSIWNYGLQVERCSFSSTILTDNINNLPDLVINQVDTQLTPVNTLYNQVLYTVAGRVFFEHLVDDRAYLMNASIYLDYYQSQHISIIDFSALGGFDRYVCTTENCTVIHETEDHALVTMVLPVSIKGKTPLLILNGILRILDDHYVVIDDTKIAITLPYTELLTEVAMLPVNSLGWIQATNVEHTGYNLDSLNPLAYLTTGNSAIIVLDTGELSIVREPLLKTGFTGRYTLPYIPTGILYLQDGSMGDYVVSSTTDYGNEISTTHPTVLRALKDTTPFSKMRGVNNSTLSFPDTNSRAEMVTLYTL